MHMERLLRMISGAVVLATVILGIYHHQNWLYVTGVIGLSLFQSGFTNWCPMKSILQLAGVKS